MNDRNPAAEAYSRLVESGLYSQEEIAALMKEQGFEIGVPNPSLTPTSEKLFQAVDRGQVPILKEAILKEEQYEQRTANQGHVNPLQAAAAAVTKWEIEQREKNKKSPK